MKEDDLRQIGDLDGRAAPDDAHPPFLPGRSASEGRFPRTLSPFSAIVRLSAQSAPLRQIEVVAPYFFSAFENEDVVSVKCLLMMVERIFALGRPALFDEAVNELLYCKRFSHEVFIARSPLLEPVGGFLQRFASDVPFILLLLLHNLRSFPEHKMSSYRVELASVFDFNDSVGALS
jgi:hypothetical protein